MRVYLVLPDENTWSFRCRAYSTLFSMGVYEESYTATYRYKDQANARINGVRLILFISNKQRKHEICFVHGHAPNVRLFIPTCLSLFVHSSHPDILRQCVSYYSAQPSLHYSLQPYAPVHQSWPTRRHRYTILSRSLWFGDPRLKRSSVFITMNAW